jgi:hypothetical protein
MNAEISLLKWLLVLAGLLILWWLSAQLARRRTRGVDNRYLRQTEALTLDTTHRVYLVRAGRNRNLLLGASGTGLNLLSVLTDDELEALDGGSPADQ